MAVNLPAPDPAALHPVPGVELGVAMAGVRKANRKDLLVIRLAAGTTVAGVFTQNRFCAAPVVLAKQHLRNDVQALVVNAGNANAGTGKEGLARAMQVCEALASHLGCEADQILPFSTGVIMEPLPAERIVAALPRALVHQDDWLSAAESIMTTDTVPKAFSRKLRLSAGPVVVTGIAKGAGMIRPDMATMLAFIATDARVSQRNLQGLLERVAERSFNCVTVDGDTSTNDSLILAATGQGAAASTRRDLLKLEVAVGEVARHLAQAIVRDGEGATKFVTVQVERGRNADECRRVAYAVAHSPLVKTAFFASDPNLGRILAAIGNSGVRGIDKQMERVEQNTRQFLDARPANNVLLTGARGTGKSSIVKGLLNKYARQGVRLIEVEKNDLIDLPQIVDQVAGRRERFLLFCDDLSFHGAEDGYIALKVALDGSISTTSENMLIYATSNRRHLMPEYMAEKLETKYVGDEIHPGETVEEKISLSERFGLRATFYPFDQDEYLAIVAHWLKTLGAKWSDAAREQALQWSLQRGSRSGRVAYQFSRE